MTISSRTLVKIAAWGGVIVSTTGFYLQHRLIDKFRDKDYYKNALKMLRTHAGAVYYLGEPIKDKRFKITDPQNNSADDKSAKFKIPVSGPKDRGTYSFWAEKIDEEWKLTRAELELKSKPDSKLVAIKMLKHFVGTSREQFFYHNTLLCLLKALEGKNITVDLRNDTHVCGEVAIVDGYMNISFATAVFVDAQGDEFLYDHLFVQGRNIRYIHIPENMAAEDTIKSEIVKTKPRPPDHSKIQKSRKAKKAHKLHMQTVASLQEKGTSDNSYI